MSTVSLVQPRLSEQDSQIQQLAAPFQITPEVAVKNRIYKSAMSEALAELDGTPTEELVRLYGAWAQGGAGIVVTGNVMVDHRAIGEPGNVVVEDERHLAILKRWAEAGTKNDTQLWAQLNHPGKQAPRGLNVETVAPSAIPFSRKLSHSFGKPRALTHDEILDIIQRFGKAAAVFKKAGFSGIEIHSAHGYLLNQFLSPLHNQRKDEWGGDIDGRMKFVLEVYKSIRDSVGTGFPVAVKLNSADFQKGGFTEDESLKVIQALSEAGVDAFEISGGTYEAPALVLGGKVKESTKIREAYFLDFAEKVRSVSKVPLIVTGGFRTLAGMSDALAGGDLDLVGMARPAAMIPDAPQQLLDGKLSVVPTKDLVTGIKPIASSGMLEIFWYAKQMQLIAKGKKPSLNDRPLVALVKILLSMGVKTIKYRSLRA